MITIAIVETFRFENDEEISGVLQKYMYPTPGKLHCTLFSREKLTQLFNN